MSNKQRRVFNKMVHKHGGHISPDQRAMNKEEDGIPVQSLPATHRRYWSSVNHYAKLRDESLYYLSLEAA